MTKSYKILVPAILGMIFLIGIAIPKLTVRDAFPLNDQDRSCVKEGVQQQFDHPLQRLALALGKSAVVGKQGSGTIKPNTLIVESYTIFRIPLPTTTMFNRFKKHSVCDWGFEEIDSVFLEGVEFTEKLQAFVLKNIGQPIEGFSATVYLTAFPGLLNVDFNNVETLGGIYAYSNGKLNFVRKESNRISTADEMLVEKGHETLLSNIRNRLGNNLSLDEIIKGITAQGIGHVKGTILLGPTCPVVKDTPDAKCAGKPIFGEFIIQNAMGNIEFTRFGTQRDGSFSVPLPTGEYYITWAEPQGPGVQGHLVNVLAGNTSEYTIIFSAGIKWPY